MTKARLTGNHWRREASPGNAVYASVGRICPRQYRLSAASLHTEDGPVVTRDTRVLFMVEELP